MKSDIVQYYVVNKDLLNNHNMSTGKISAQIAHAAQRVERKIQKENLINEDYETWMNTGETKVILKAKEKDLNKLINDNFIGVIDEGRTEIPKNSLTVVALYPMKKDEAKKYIKRFRLL